MSLIERYGNLIYELSEKGIRNLIEKGEFLDYFWEYIDYDKVSERFIREYQDKVAWHCVAKKKNLSASFRAYFNLYDKKKD